MSVEAYTPKYLQRVVNPSSPYDKGELRTLAKKHDVEKEMNFLIEQAVSRVGIQTMQQMSEYISDSRYETFVSVDMKDEIQRNLRRENLSEKMEDVKKVPDLFKRVEQVAGYRIAERISREEIEFTRPKVRKITF